MNCTRHTLYVYGVKPAKATSSGIQTDESPDTYTLLGTLVLSGPVHYDLLPQGNLPVQHCLCFFSFLHEEQSALVICL